MELAFLAVPLWIFLATNLLLISAVFLFLFQIKRQLQNNTDRIFKLDLWAASVDQMITQQRKIERQQKIRNIVDQQALAGSWIRH